MGKTATPDAPAAPAATPDTPDADAPEMVEGAHNPFVHSLLGVAKRLEGEHTALAAKVSANRETLRAMRTQNLMSTDQADAVEAFYPTRTRKAKTDTDAS